MKLKKIFSLIAVLSFLAVPAYAAESLPVDARITAPETVSASADVFRAVVTGDGRLIVKPGKVFSEGDDTASMEMPYLLSNPKPIDYPRWAIRQGWQGDMTAAVEILPTGKVGRSMVMQSTGHSVLDEAAIKALSQWIFKPAMKEGKPVLTCIQVPIRFQIDSKN